MKSSEHWPEVCVIILNYNGWPDTLECLESLLRQDYPAFRVLVVDNHSTDNSVEMIRRWAGGKLDIWLPPENPLRHLSNPPLPKPLPLETVHPEAETVENFPRFSLLPATGNFGFGKGNNLGLRLAKKFKPFEYFWLLNNDAVVAPDALKRLVEKAQISPGSGVSGSRLLEYHSPHTTQSLGATVQKFWGRTRPIWDEKHLYRLLYVVGASFLISRNCLESVGLLPEEYFLYHEEADYCFRARLAGQRLAIAPESHVYHKEGISTTSLYKDYYGLRNTLYFNRKYFGKYIVTTTLWFFLRVFKRLARLQFRNFWISMRAIVDFLRGRMGRTI